MGMKRERQQDRKVQFRGPDCSTCVMCEQDLFYIFYCSFYCFIFQIESPYERSYPFAIVTPDFLESSHQTYRQIVPQRRCRSDSNEIKYFNHEMTHIYP